MDGLIKIAVGKKLKQYQRAQNCNLVIGNDMPKSLEDGVMWFSRLDAFPKYEWHNEFVIHKHKTIWKMGTPLWLHLYLCTPIMEFGVYVYMPYLLQFYATAPHVAGTLSKFIIKTIGNRKFKTFFYNLGRREKNTLLS
ncbi:hypothetical protein ACJX0J_015974 [Zea mays]